MISSVAPDIQKSMALRKSAKITLDRLNTTDKEAYPSNTLLDYYDAIHNLLEAISLRDGIKTRGEGAHQELIDYVSKKHALSEQTRQFLQQMREYRNRISYEGFTIHRNYIALNEEKIQEIIGALLRK